MAMAFYSDPAMASARAGLATVMPTIANVVFVLVALTLVVAGVIVATTVLDFGAAEWAAVSAFGIWATMVVYVVLAWYAKGQLDEARTLRREQTRPYVIAEFGSRSILILLLIRNIGATPAYNVKVHLDERLTSVEMKDVPWQDSGAFNTGIPSMAPGAELRFLVDSFPRRLEAGLPMTIDGTITYSDRFKASHTEPFVIDLEVYGSALLALKDLDDLVDELEKLRREVSKWSAPVRGLLVRARDEDRRVLRNEHAYHRRLAAEAREREGWKGAAQYYIALWLQRRGWR